MKKKPVFQPFYEYLWNRLLPICSNLCQGTSKLWLIFYEISVLFLQLNQDVTSAKPSLKMRTAISLCLFTDYGLYYIFFRNKTFFVFQDRKLKIFSVCLKKNFLKPQDFNSIRQRIEKMEIIIVRMSWKSWNFVRFHEIPFQTGFSLLKPGLCK